MIVAQPRTVLLTGVTGLVGGALALELLRHTDAHLLCVVRPRGERSAAQRLTEALHASSQAYGQILSADDLARCRAIAGDITAPALGVDPGEIERVDEVWHVAASLAFEDERAEEISLHNVAGTEHMLDVARELSCRAFNYVSTAYVAGTARGRILETPVPIDSPVNNHYERTKLAAERLVLGADFETVRVFRPSIVIGHSATYGATTFTGLYGFVRGLQRARDTVRESLGDLLRFRPLRLLADGGTPVNFIPVDVVARAAVAISIRSTDSAIYHLTNPTPPRLIDCWHGATEVLGMQRPIFVSDRREFTLIDEKVDERMTFYRSYMNDEKYFDMSNVQAVLGPDALTCDLAAHEIVRYVGWYVQHVGASEHH